MLAQAPAFPSKGISSDTGLDNRAQSLFIWPEGTQGHLYPFLVQVPRQPWQIDGETVADFIFLGFKITADGDCSHETKRRLLLGRKVMTSLDNILKSRDITLSTKVHLAKAMVFPMVLYGCES